MRVRQLRALLAQPGIPDDAEVLINFSSYDPVLDETVEFVCVVYQEPTYDEKNGFVYLDARPQEGAEGV